MMRSFVAALLLLSPFHLEDVNAPSGSTPLISVRGRGVQIYRCTHTEQGERWVLEAPEATLYDTANLPVGSHGAGPVWTWKDGSSVKGSVVKKEASPANSIPWLLLSAVPAQHPTGFLSNVRWVRRSDTEGGLAPETGCDAGHEQVTARVPYSAQYTFYTDASFP